MEEEKLQFTHLVVWGPDPSTLEQEAWGSGFQGQSEFKVSLCYLRHCLHRTKKLRKKKKERERIPLGQERWHCGEGKVLLFQVQFPTVTLDNSRLPIPTVPRDPIPSSKLHRHFHLHEYTQAYVHTIKISLNTLNETVSLKWYLYETTVMQKLSLGDPAIGIWICSGRRE